MTLGHALAATAYLLSWPIGWAIGLLFKGRPLAGLLWGWALGPVGWLVLIFLYGPAVTCPRCGRKTPDRPPPNACRGCRAAL